MPCTKRKYTLQQAQQALKEIEVERKTDAKRKEVRYYPCIRCSDKFNEVYHLTSISESDLSVLTEKKKARTKKNAYLTAQYWIKKMNWK